MFAEPIRYTIVPVAEGWIWTTYAVDGRVCDRGVVASRAVAAAHVIRCIARSCRPEPARLRQAA